jgi:hypothetical protein
MGSTAGQTFGWKVKNNLCLIFFHFLAQHFVVLQFFMCMSIQMTLSFPFTKPKACWAA